MSDASKPYLDWLDNNASPPALLSTAGWTRAASVLITRLRQARDAVVNGDPLQAVEEYTETDNKLSALVTWVEHIGPRTPRIRKDSLRSEVCRLNRRRERISRTASRGRGLAVLDGLMRRRRKPLNPAQKSMVDDLRTNWRSYRTPLVAKNGIRTERALARHYKREETYQDECLANGVPLTRAQARQLPPIYRAQARLAARQRGWNRGWFVTADSDLGREALAHLNDRALRESLWRQRQAIKETALSISEVLRLRHEEAKHNGHENYASFLIQSRAIGQVRSVSALLHGFLEASRSAAAKLDRRLQALAQELGLDEVNPWDRHWLVERLRERLRFSHEPAQSFALNTMVEVVIPELFAVGGWEVESLTFTGEGRRRQWIYDLVKNPSSVDGQPQRRAQFWFAPFNPRNHEAPNEGGYEMIVRDRWRAVGAEVPLARHSDHVPSLHAADGRMATGSPLVVVVLGLKPSTRWLSWTEVTWLVHEIGHALHDLDLDPVFANYTGELSWDMIEFPSQLFERLTQDPHTLARWAAASPGSSPLTRRPMFWRKWLVTDVECIDHVRHFALHALMDLTIHRQKVSAGDIVDPQAIYRKLADRYGFPCHEDDRTGYLRFIWEGYAASDYTYIFGQMLARIVMPKRSDGTVDGNALKQLYAEILEHVLSPGVSGAKFARAWRNWYGESLRASFEKGAKLYAADLRHFAKIASSC